MTRAPLVLRLCGALALLVAGCDAPLPIASVGEGTVLGAIAPARVTGSSREGGHVEHGHYLASTFVCRERDTTRGADGEHLDSARDFGGGIPFEGRWGVVEAATVSLVATRLPADVLASTVRGRLAHEFQMPTDLSNAMAADDMRDRVAYLRSLPPVTRARPKSHFAEGFAPPPPNAPVVVPEHAPRGRTRSRGEYLVVQSICKECHSPRLADGVGHDDAHFMSGGGFAFRRTDGVDITPPNLTHDEETGIGTWSEDDIVRAPKTGMAEDGHRSNPFMPYGVAGDVAASTWVRLRHGPPRSSSSPGSATSSSRSTTTSSRAFRAAIRWATPTHDGAAVAAATTASAEDDLSEATSKEIRHA